MGFVAGVHQLRNLFQSLDKDGSGSVSRFEFREFLKPYNLNLSPDALTSLVDLFDDDHDGAPPHPTHTHTHHHHHFLPSCVSISWLG